MKTTTLLLFFVFGLGITHAQEKPCQLVVKVKNIKNIKGNLMLGVYNQGEKFLKKEVVSGDIKIDGNSMTYTFDGLDKGFYAVSIFQDENENGKLDSNFMGIPSEPYAFSNNAKGMFGPPSFEDCRFEVFGERHEIVINL